MRKAHEDLPLNETHFNAIAEGLTATLVELKIDKALIDQVLPIVASTRDEVLSRRKTAAANAAAK